VLGGWLLVTALACATAAWRPSARAVGSATVRPPGRGNGYGLP
jgi:hypothetical protein